VPLLANMTEFGKTPYIKAETFKEMGFAMVIYPVTSLRVAAKAYERVFDLIKQEGTQKEGVSDMQTRKELYETISYDDFEELDQDNAKTVLSNDQYDYTMMSNLSSSSLVVKEFCPIYLPPVNWQ